VNVRRVGRGAGSITDTAGIRPPVSPDSLLLLNFISPVTPY